jgi:hypothetical protein
MSNLSISKYICENEFIINICYNSKFNKMATRKPVSKVPAKKKV